MHPKSRAFTLIELLVVISIIALLIGILLPALSSARKQASNIACGMGLKQIGVAIFAYGSDFKGQIPVGPDTIHPTMGEATSKYLNTLDNQLWIGSSKQYTSMGVLYHGYLENKQAFFCPADDDIADVQEELAKIDTGDDAYGSYFYRSLDEVIGDTRFSAQAQNSIGEKPSVLAMDRQSIFPSIPEGLKTNHSNDASNLLFRDGRVQLFANNNEQNIFAADQADFTGSFPTLLDQLIQNADRVGNGGSPDDVPNP
ncbi:MAG: hypothetical protein CMJ19_08325 [Phycisphaeraceae bacterium]|nr:hypothetical protein [Phycisphaeraceae bacterium]